MGDQRSDDPLQGWRLRATQFLHPAPKMELAVREYARRFERHEPDAITVRFCCAGRHLPRVPRT